MSFPWASPFSFVFEEAAPAVDYSIELVEDHCAEGQLLFLEEFKDKPRLEALLCAYLDQLTEMEAAAFQLLRERAPDSAVGAQLDVIGRIVGQPRESLDDETYRIFLKVRIRVNRSSGTPEEIISIARLALEDTEALALREEYPAAIVVVSDFPLIAPRTPEVIIQFLRQSKPAGVRILLEYISDPPTGSFTFSSTDEVETSSSMGFGDTADADTGGRLAGVIE